MLLHAEWPNGVPTFTSDEFKELIRGEAKRLGISDAMLQKYVGLLFGVKLCAPDLRAFALASDKKIKEELRAMEIGSVLANEKVQELRKVLELIRAIGMCSECVKDEDREAE